MEQAGIGEHLLDPHGQNLGGCCAMGLCGPERLEAAREQSRQLRKVRLEMDGDTRHYGDAAEDRQRDDD